MPHVAGHIRGMLKREFREGRVTPEQVETREQFRLAIIALQERHGIVDVLVEGNERFGIRFGQVMKIPRIGLYNPDPRFKTLDEFTLWLKANKKSGVIAWRPFPEDERFIEPLHVPFWFEAV